MIGKWLTQIFGSKNERELKKLQPLVEAVNALEPGMKAMSDQLDVASKFDRSPEFMPELRIHGEERAADFLDTWFTAPDDQLERLMWPNDAHEEAMHLREAVAHT